MEMVKMSLEDIDGVYLIEQIAYKNPWTKNNFLDELKNPYSRMYVLKEQNYVLGYVGAWVVLDEADITKVTIIPNLQNKGLGKYIFTYMLKKLQEENVRQINLEVRKSNESAIHLYKLFGFEQIAIRKKYYADGEDAIIMVRTMDGGTKSEKIHIGN